MTLLLPPIRILVDHNSYPNLIMPLHSKVYLQLNRFPADSNFAFPFWDLLGSGSNKLSFRGATARVSIVNSFFLMICICTPNWLFRATEIKLTSCGNMSKKELERSRLEVHERELRYYFPSGEAREWFSWIHSMRWSLWLTVDAWASEDRGRKWW